MNSRIRWAFRDLTLFYTNRGRTSIYLNVPYAVSYQQENDHSSGLNDVFVQLEYAYYYNQNNVYSETATIVFNTSFPTGSYHKNPSIGWGAQAFFVGGTYSRMYTDWLGFFSPGIEMTTTRHGIKSGNSFLYQLGVGRNISYETSRYIFSWLLEFNGTYFQKNRINGELDRDSGGNIIYAVPSLWLSTQHVILQAGAGWAIAQHWNGDQSKDTYLIAFNLGWTF